MKLLLTAALALGVSPGLAMAQTSNAQTPDPTITRSPIQGDKGSQASTARPSAKVISKADKQPPGTENGNQPDRAAAGGGAR